MTEISSSASIEPQRLGLIPSRGSIGLLSLPTEIRLRIFCFALKSGEDNPLNPFWQQNVRFSWDGLVIRSHRDGRDGRDEDYWGTERMTRLLRVNRQIHVEAEGVLYGDLTVAWPSGACACIVPLFLAKRSDRVPQIVRRLNVALFQVIDKGDDELAKGRKRTQAFYQSLVAALPALTFVQLSVAFLGADVDESTRGHVVENIVRMAAVFRGVDHLELWYVERPRMEQRVEMVREARERIRRREWGDGDAADPDFVCCTEKLKARRMEDIH